MATLTFQRTNSIEDDIEHINEVFSLLQKRIDQLEKENEHLRSESYKDEELANMKKRVEDIEEHMRRVRQDAYRGFPITAEEHDQIIHWMGEHEEKVHEVGTKISAHAFHGVSGGNYTYEFVPTSIGIIGYVVCGACGEKFCFQDLV